MLSCISIRLRKYRVKYKSPSILGWRIYLHFHRRGRIAPVNWVAQMNMHIELLQFYRCKTLSDLLDRTSDVFANIGFPHLVMKWSPAAASSGKMIENSSMIWNNFGGRFGRQADDLAEALKDSISIGIEQEPQDTLDLHRWRQSQDGSFQLSGDAPKPFYLTRYQQSIIQDFGEAAWTEFIVLRLSRERERLLVLEVKTQDRLTLAMLNDAHAVLSVFACVYQCLNRPIAGPSVGPETGDAQKDLSKRELQCLQWLAAGKTYSEAATILEVSERTLRFHVGNARQKLGVSTTMQAVVAAALHFGFDPIDPRQSRYFLSRAPFRSATQKAG